MKKFFFQLIACVLILSVSVELKSQSEVPASRSVCLLKGKDGNGSGFFAEVDGQNVIITNNHVILGIKDVKISDINGQEYAYDMVYASPKQDLAVIPVNRKNFTSMPNLSIHRSPDRVPVNTTVTAFGDSLGDGVIVAAKGKFLGIGPEVLEVNAGFVPGNSGGPVIEHLGGRVLGVATYSIVRGGLRPEAIGSRFRSTRFTPSIRRFAVRIDRLTLSGMEKLTRPQREEDRRVWARYEKLGREITEILRSPGKNEVKLFRVRALLEKASYRTMPFPVHWNSTWLGKECEKRRQALDALWNALFKDKVTPLVPTDEQAQKIINLWRENLSEARFFKTQPLYANCLVCKGKKTLVGFMDKERTKGQKKVIHPSGYNICFHCSGQGRVPITGGMEYAIPGDRFQQSLPSLIQMEPNRFSGLPIGGICSLPFPGRKPEGAVYFQIFRVLRYAGHPKLRDVTETRLWFIGDLLLRIDLIIPAPDSDYIAQTRENMDRQLSPFRQTVFSVTPAQRFSDRARTKAAAQAEEEFFAGKRQASPFGKIPAAYDRVQRLKELQSLAVEDPFRRYFFQDTRFQLKILFPAYCRITVRHKDFDTLASLIRIRDAADTGFSF